MCPKFEEDRRELIPLPLATKYAAGKNESPYATIVSIVKDRGAKYKRIGIEERVRFFIMMVFVKQQLDLSGGCHSYNSRLSYV